MKSRTEAVTRTGGRRGRAFTLLEVLAAVAILGLLYVAFASYALHGLRQEGENERRIRASLLADRALADVETGISEGDFPSDQGDEFDEDEFHVTVELLPITGLEAPNADPGLDTLLQGDLAGLAKDLHTVRVQVTWTEGTAEQHVSRITYAWDSGPLYEALGVTPGGAGDTDAGAAGGDGGAGAGTNPSGNPTGSTPSTSGR